MGKFINTDRVYIFDYDFDKKVTSNTYEWCSSYATRELDNLQDIPIESIKSWVAEHKKGNSIHIRDVSKLSDNDSVKEILQFQGIKSVLSVPMMIDGECIGFAGFDSVREKKEYSKREIRLLNLFVQMLVNVFSRKKQEDLLYSQIKEREILINEIHHRVKNNLQIISSFLYLQSQYTKDKNIKQILNTTNNRIKAMAILHEKIYKGDNLDKFSFKTYLEEINRQLFDHYGYDKNIDFELEIEDININLNRAIPIGLIINELVTNAVQHAFVGKSKGVLIVKVFSKNSSLIINIEDNGVGFNIEKIKEEGSLGLVIVDSLINQLGGSYNIESKDGTEYHISLPMQNLI
jgi:two-component sensor histidine kinase